ncbi:hypothetical protein OMW55_09450 [Sphingomonas sp. BN140010]|uniref:EF-hand domain-containing protein n=1 Tax=Sphingomonas arvum TaxID=2992113 RepID=A0ABT3JG30_9SPHN|nr:hypothetical protein [Sphingomonas sp. BN140010]MCW3798027.1 hypothetical protein [Sphingomonas sp. BN140010]
MLAFALFALAAAPPNLNPAAADLFERDPELKAWAVTRFDLNGDGWLTSFEAQPALLFFKDVADTNQDGRVTVSEYSAAKAYLQARDGGLATAVSAVRAVTAPPAR